MTPSTNERQTTFPFTNTGSEGTKRPHVLVVGDVMLDRYWYGHTSRVSPEAPVPVVHVDHDESRPGGAANVALNLRHLGADVTVIGIIGNDSNGQILVHKLEQEGIRCAFVTADNIATITKLRIMAQNQQLVRTDFEHAPMTSEGILDQLLAQFADALATADAVILSDYAKGCLRPAHPYIEQCHQANIPVVVDPKGNDWLPYSGATLITPNFKEFTEACGTIHSEQAIREHAQRLISELQLSALLVTRGADGMSLFEKTGAQLHIPTKAREVFDVTGAGDTVIATLALCLAHGQSLAEAVTMANTAAGIVVGKLGTATVAAEELRHALCMDHTSLNAGIVTESQLVQLRRQFQRDKKRVVMTNGCFDLLHPGHLDYLQRAKSLGDVLIVAINDDDSVQRLKGPLRPLNPLMDRMQHLAALNSVDYVVPFTEDTPSRLISLILPDLLVKGGDYQIEDIAGGDAVYQNGGEVKTLPFKQGYSSSALIAKILQTHQPLTEKN